MQLWNKQRTSVFASSWRRSRVIFIEKHFKPICSKMTSTTHSVTIRKRWFVKWAVSSSSSCAKQCQKCKFLRMPSLWNQGIVDCTCGDLLVESEASQHLHQWRLRFLYPASLHQEGATSWCSARQNWGTEKAFHSHKARRRCLKKKFWRNSRSLPTRFNISWFRSSKLAGLRRRALRWTN